MNPKCPKCNSEKVVPIVYGPPPTEEMRERAAKGEIMLWGCLVGDDPPFFHCSDCRHDWR